MTTSGLEAVFLENRDKLVRSLASLGANDAEDLLQELWLRIQSSRHGPVAAPLPYLYRAAHNLMLDRYRSARKSAARESAWSAVTGAGDGDLSHEPSAERLLIAREQANSVDEALQAIGERAARVFRRHRLDGVEQRVVAAELGVSLSTVEADLRKAYSKMIELKRRFDEA
ncbi:RNA polymerase sigma factor [Sphingomonas sp. PB4P5]|uniref:RNA polymerase sigma factor n=1 Tax=Parasphingomonas puruogangriensis TaxID=3096155 RepID=UPI002FCC24CD